MDILESIYLWCFSWHYIVYSAMGNGNHSRYNMGLLMIEPEVVGSKLWLIHFYQEQLDKFAKLGLGKFTEFDTKITEALISTTQKRLDQLAIMYDGKLTSRAHALRKMKMRRINKDRLNGQKVNNNRATITPRVQSNGDTGHEEDGS